MIIHLTELLSNEGKVKDITAEYESNMFSTVYGDYDITDKKPLNIHLTNLGKKTILIETEIAITLNIPCDRCLQDVSRDFCIEVTKEVDLNDAQDTKDDMEELSYLTDGDLDVDKLVYEELLVNLPAKTVCKSDCKGLCRKCGKNLNYGTCDCDTEELDPRMAKIRDIFKNFD